MFITLKSKESNWLFCKTSSINRCKPVISEILRTKKHVWKNLTKWIGLWFLIWTISFTGFSQQLCKEIKCHLTKRFGIPGKPVLFEFSWWDCWRLFNSHQGGHHRDSGAVEAKCVSLAGFGFFFLLSLSKFWKCFKFGEKTVVSVLQSPKKHPKCSQLLLFIQIIVCTHTFYSSL